MERTPCRYLRTKRLFIPNLATDAFAQSERRDEICQCWCNRTMTELGLDDRQVSFQYCTDPARACYRES
jgi:hypothetical protein